MLCKCGCGQVTTISPRNRKHLGHVKGQHIDFCHSHALRGRKRVFTQEWKDNIANGCMGRKPWNKGKPSSEEWKAKLRGRGDAKLGDKNPNWKGGIDQKIRGIRRSREYLRLKAFVRARDKTCVWCGSCERLHVDHIKSFTYYPELRFDPANCRLLCFRCHIKTPNFGSKSKGRID